MAIAFIPHIRTYTNAMDDMCTTRKSSCVMYITGAGFFDCSTVLSKFDTYVEECVREYSPWSTFPIISMINSELNGNEI